MPAVMASLATAAGAWNTRLPRTWSNRLGLTLTPISTGLWAAERPHRIGGFVDVGARTAIARASDGSLVVHEPGRLSHDLKSDLTNEFTME